ncbi:hypothetical protein J23TS9_05870 [Paenibacillus sp. J23TS9]|uniref:hypothetical protein n=1 Tax=Paenibacillus sp. J23TS9 TaxID=2807193 RepID=UPI001B1245E3|nr:hypothetical protein [Paenibacillus sp. J23TS9]GIP25457.1 hypothetical protein J23TS9_05870 [Paenibacillus sp. J23TS9]
MNQSKYAAGGIVSGEHLRTIGDDTPERIIPLSGAGIYSEEIRRAIDPPDVTTIAERIASNAKDLYDELVEKFGDDDRVMDMVIAAMPSISAEAYRSRGPRLAFTDTAVSISESLKIDNTADAEERKKSLQALVSGIFNRTSSDRRKWLL